MSQLCTAAGERAAAGPVTAAEEPGGGVARGRGRGLPRRLRRRPRLPPGAAGLSGRCRCGRGRSSPNRPQSVSAAAVHSSSGLRTGLLVAACDRMLYDPSASQPCVCQHCSCSCFQAAVAPHAVAAAPVRLFLCLAAAAFPRPAAALVQPPQRLCTQVSHGSAWDAAFTAASAHQPDLQTILCMLPVPRLTVISQAHGNTGRRFTSCITTLPAQRSPTGCLLGFCPSPRLCAPTLSSVSLPPDALG